MLSCPGQSLGAMHGIPPPMPEALLLLGPPELVLVLVLSPPDPVSPLLSQPYPAAVMMNAEPMNNHVARIRELPFPGASRVAPRDDRLHQGIPWTLPQNPPPRALPVHPASSILSRG